MIAHKRRESKSNCARQQDEVLHKQLTDDYPQEQRPWVRGWTIQRMSSRFHHLTFASVHINQ